MSPTCGRPLDDSLEIGSRSLAADRELDLLEANFLGFGWWRRMAAAMATGVLWFDRVEGVAIRTLAVTWLPTSGIRVPAGTRTRTEVPVAETV